MRTNVELDHLFSLNEFDPKKTAKQIDVMRQEGLNLSLRVRHPQTTEVFKYLPSSRQPLRLLLRWLVTPQGIFAVIGIITYVAVAIVMF